MNQPSQQKAKASDSSFVAATANDQGASKEAPKSFSKNRSAPPAPVQIAGTPFTRFLVLIQQRGGSATVDVPEWEIPVLEQIWGDEAVTILGERQEFWKLTASETMAMMENKYKQKDEEGRNPVSLQYPNVREFAKQSGLPYTPGDSKRNRNNEAAIVDHSNAWGGEISGQSQNTAQTAQRFEKGDTGSWGTGSGQGGDGGE